MNAQGPRSDLPLRPELIFELLHTYLAIKFVDHLRGCAAIAREREDIDASDQLLANIEMAEAEAVSSHSAMINRKSRFIEKCFQPGLKRCQAIAAR